MKANDLLQRLLIHSVSLVIIFIFIVFGASPLMKWIFTLAIASICAVASWEYYQLVKKKNLSPSVILGIIFSISYIFAVFFKTQGAYGFLPALFDNLPEIILGLAFFGCFIFFALKQSSPISNIATSFLGIIYISVPMSFFIQIMYFKFEDTAKIFSAGGWWLLYLLAVTKSADMGGYFIGRKFGKRKLLFKISPKKTYEGALAGFFASIIVSLLVGFLGKRFGNVFQDIAYIHFFLLGLLVGLMGQMGDLAESMLKRDANVKDSNHIPAVGGILDMIDSLLFTSPIVYIFLKILNTSATKLL